MFYYIIPFLFYIFFAIPVGPCQCHGSKSFLKGKINAAISCSIHLPILELLVPGVKSLRSKDTAPKCGKMFPIVHCSLFVYFALVISQFRFRKLIINYGVIILGVIILLDSFTSSTCSATILLKSSSEITGQFSGGIVVS